MQTAELAVAPVAEVRSGMELEQTLPLAVADSFVDLQEGIRFAMSWRELEGWIDRATAAHARGKLVLEELEELVELAIRISRQVAES